MLERKDPIGRQFFRGLRILSNRGIRLFTPQPCDDLPSRLLASADLDFVERIGPGPASKSIYRRFP